MQAKGTSNRGNSKWIRSQFRVAASENLLWIGLACAVVGDILTTFAAQVTFGTRFAELGGIAGTWMRLSPSYWYLLQFASEFTIFGIVTAVFAKSKRVSFGVPMKWWSLATVLTLVGWNVGMLAAFKLVLI